MKIFVNAVSAKKGGAKTILEGFIQSVNSDGQNTYVVYAGFNFEGIVPDNVKWVYHPKEGIDAFLFNTLWSFFFMAMERAEVILSFNNINTVIPCRKVTYFHQLKVLDVSDRSIKSKFLRAYYACIKSDNIIVQTHIVKAKFVSMLSYDYNKVEVVWPGIKPVDIRDRSMFLHSSVKRFILVPYTDISSAHKNFDFVLKCLNVVPSDFVFLVTTTSVDSNLDERIHFIGNVSREELFQLYADAEFVLFPSMLETIGLPIFEAVSIGSNVVVYDAEYIREFEKEYNFHGLVKKVSCPEEIFSTDGILNSNIEGLKDFRCGQWDKLIDQFNKFN